MQIILENIFNSEYFWQITGHCSNAALYLLTQQVEVGSNPVQVETGEFDEAIEVVEDVAAESK